MLGPLLFILYTTPLSKIIHNSKDVYHHRYAHDTQTYNHLNKSNFAKSIKNLQNCLVFVQDWMFANKLKLNPDKSEYMLIGNKCYRDKIQAKFLVDILGNKLSPAPYARNLGVISDADLNFMCQINSVVKSLLHPGS